MSEKNRVIDVDTGITADELEDVINDAPKGATIRLEAGNFVLDDAVTITRSDISLVGAGSDRTTLTFSDEALARNDDYGLRLDGSENEFIGRLDDDVEEGSRRIELDRAHDLEAGDSVRVWQDNDDAFFDEIGDTSWRKQQYAELRTSMAKVESVDGDTITLDRSVHFDFDDGKTQVERLATVDDVSLEGFSVGFELGRPDKTEFDNTLHDLRGYHAVSLESTVNSTLDDIRVVDGPSIAFHFSKTLAPDVERIEAHGTFNKGSGGNGYAYELRESYDGTFTQLEDTGMRHGLLFASWRSSVDNKVHVASTDRDINFHGGRDHNNSVHVERSIRDAEADALSPALWINAGGESFGAITDAEANEVVFDYVIGSRREDTIQGSDAGVYLNGGLGHDTLIGGRGDDMLQGGPGDDWYDGNDRLNGGDGDDTALYLQGYDAYNIGLDDGEIVVEAKDKGGKDILDDIERIVFGDGTILDTESRDVSHGDAARAPSPAEILDDTSADVSVSGNVTSAWSGGYVAEVLVENTSDDAIVDPEMRFDLPAVIDTLWNGSVSGSGSDYRVVDDNRGVLESGEVWRFAYKAYGNDRALPDDVAIQGDGTDDLEIQLLGMPASQVDDIAG